MREVLRHLLFPQTSNNHRPRLLHVEGLAVLSGILVGSHVLVSYLSAPGYRLPAILGFSSSITVSQVVDQTNAHRTANGLVALSANAALNQAASAKAAHMCGNNYWAHVSPQGIVPWKFMRDAGYRYSVAGENLARDFGDTGSMVNAWMASPTHKANILNSKYKEIGVAVVDCNLLGHDTTLVVQMFGSRTVTSAGRPRVPTTPTNTARVQSEMIEEPVRDEGLPIDESIAGQQSVPAPLQHTEPILLLPTPEPVAVVPYVFTPLQVTKAILLSMVAVLFVALCVDLWLSHQKGVVRIAGKNLGHVLLFSGVAMVVVLIKAGATL